MDKEKYIEELRKSVESMVGKDMRTPKDFSMLSEQVFNRLKILLSPTTLKRLWGYIKDEGMARKSTLSILSQFVGYRDWESFCLAIENGNEVQSNLILSRKLSAYALVPGPRVVLTWLPNRYCEIELRKDINFIVIESKNTKIKPGDTFDCSLFIEGEPLYVDNLVHEELCGISYVAGKKDGIRFELIDK